MASIRKQSIISILLVYVGFVIGAVNTYLYVKSGSAFSPAQYGLTKIFFDFGQNMFTIASLGVMPVIYKFYPYYKDNLEEHKIDLVTWAMIAALVGFILVTIVGIYFEPLIARKYTERSKLIVDYYYWMFPFALGMLCFSVIEGFCWAVQKTVFSNFLKETVMRLVTTIFILLFYFRWISFATFMHLFSSLYAIIFLVLIIYLRREGKLYLNLKITRVTKKFYRKMFTMQFLTFSSTVISSLALTLDGPIIAGFRGISAVAIFAMAQYVANLVVVPQRSIQAIAAGVLSKAWKDKDLGEISRIYERSCINLLLLALFIFGNVWLNLVPAMHLVGIGEEYYLGVSVVLILSIARIIDAGTGVNGTIIGTSLLWRFDFITTTGILLVLRLPLTWILIKRYGIVGAAYADVTAVVAFNYVRFEFLRRKFGMQPFHLNNLYSLLLAVVAYLVPWLLLGGMGGWTGLGLRAVIFSGIMAGGVWYFRLTPDVMQLYHRFLARREK